MKETKTSLTKHGERMVEGIAKVWDSQNDVDKFSKAITAITARVDAATGNKPGNGYR